VSARARNPRVILQPRSISSLRRRAGVLRLVVVAAAAAGIVATARLAIAPPAGRITIVRPQSQYDPAGAWAAEQFARECLTWGATGAGSAVVQPSPGGSDSVSWTDVASTRDIGRGTTEYLVAVDTSLHGVVYLDLVLARRGPGRYAPTRYPALVAAPDAPSAGTDLDTPALPSVANAQLERVLERALGHYVGADTTDLAADLAPDAVVSPPSLRLALRRIEHLAVEPSGVVLATLVATDAQGNAYTLTYGVGLTFAGDRWELTAINADPSSRSGRQT